MALKINLEFSQSLNEFKYNAIDEPEQGDFKTIVRDFDYEEAQRFVTWIRDVFPLPLLYVSVVLQFNIYKNKNNL
jgi:hypothetical protein